MRGKRLSGDTGMDRQEEAATDWEPPNQEGRPMEHSGADGLKRYEERPFVWAMEVVLAVGSSVIMR